MYTTASASQTPATARRISCTRTTGTRHSRMSRRKRVCTGSDGHVESRSETITTTALTTYFAPILDRSRCTEITATEISPMLRRRLAFGTINKGLEPDAPSWNTNEKVNWICSFPVTFCLRLNTVHLLSTLLTA